MTSVNMPIQQFASITNFAIVIPATDIKEEVSEKQLTNLLSSIVAWEERPFIVVCFDACSKQFIKRFTNKFPFIIPLTHSHQRLNFARNANIGLEWAHRAGLSALLVNQDCILPEVITLIELCRGDIVSAAPTKDDLKIEKLEYKEVRHKFPFFCVYIDYKVMDKIGFLDGSFISTFEDDDYITRALLAGFKCKQSSIKVIHEGSFIDSSGDWESASGSYNARRLGINLVKYKTKYQVPPEVGHEECIKWILDEHEWIPEMRINAKHIS